MGAATGLLLEYEFYPSYESVCCVCVCAVITFNQQIGHQPGMVANPARGQLNRGNGIFPVPVRA